MFCLLIPYYSARQTSVYSTKKIGIKEREREKNVSISMLLELSEVVLKNKVFTFGKKTSKQLRGTATGIKFAPSYSTLFMAELEQEILREVELKPYLWWQYIDDIFLIWKHGEEKLKEFIHVLKKNTLQ